MTLEVIGAGFGRTGTLSLKTALEQLGFGPCHHMVEVIDDLDRQGHIWNRVAEGKERDWEKVYSGYRSTVDWPGSHFYAELAEAFPEAKVILTLRDPEKWYASMKDTILKIRSVWFMRILVAITRFPMSFVVRIVLRDTFRYDIGKGNVIATYERHNAKVAEIIPAERLLVFDVRQGWEPLCTFLGVPVPDLPFPRVNDREEFAQHGKKVREAVLRARKS